jgi:hypothetical protein
MVMASVAKKTIVNVKSGTLPSHEDSGSPFARNRTATLGDPSLLLLESKYLVLNSKPPRGSRGGGGSSSSSSKGLQRTTQAAQGTSKLHAPDGGGGSSTTKLAALDTSPDGVSGKARSGRPSASLPRSESAPDLPHACHIGREKLREMTLTIREKIVNGPGKTLVEKW